MNARCLSNHPARRTAFIIRACLASIVMLFGASHPAQAQIATGTGLLGQYYNDPGGGARFTTLAVTRNDSTVNFSWNTASPGAGLQVDNFSVRWTGQVEAPVSGSYTFTTTSDDGIRLWVNGLQVINNWTDHASTTNNGVITLVAGGRYDIRLEFYEAGGQAVSRLLWAYPGQAQQVIPQAYLYPPAGAPNLGPTVSAGADTTVTFPNAATLTGTASDDGQPTPASLTLAWSQQSGPGAVTFSASASLSTTATFSTAGSYLLRLTASDGAISAFDDVVVTVNAPPVPGSGSGLVAQYFNDPGTGTRFTTFVVTRTDPVVDFNWASASPGSGIQVDNFTVRWTGQVQAPATGSYTFSTVSDDGIRLWVNGQQIINNWTNHAATTNNGVVSLLGGVRYDIQLEFYEAGGAATARLLWAYPGQGQQVIPQARLYPPGTLPNQGPTVNAGGDLTIALPSTASLTGTANDDGQPNPPGVLTTAWSMVSGPGTVTFSTPAALSTTATFSAAGTYTLRLAATDGVIPASDDMNVTVNAAPVPGSGTGLRGQYYNDPGTGTRFSTLVLTRTDPTVNFSWASASPGGGVGADNFSVRWTGQVQAPATGTYTFSTVSDDGVRLWVNGQQIINNWTNHADTTNSGVVSLASGARYDIQMEFYEAAGGATARLLWAYPGQAQQVVPQLFLYPPGGQPNQSPVVSAGADATVTLPAAASLTGTATDDGQPAPPALTSAWTKAAGLGTVTFSAPSSLTTTATFSIAGVYTLRLTVSDGAVSVSDDVTITVQGGPPPAGEVFYVATGGVDTDPGTATQPFRTLAKGVAQLGPGGTLLVGPGTYAESLIHSIPSGTSWMEPVTVRAADPANRPILRPLPGADFVMQFQEQQYIVVDGLVLDATDVTYDGMKLTIGNGAPASYIRFMNGEIRNAPGQCVLINHAASFNEFINNDIHDCGTSMYTHGIYLGANNNLIEGNRVYRNGGWGVQVYGTAGAVNDNVVRGNFIYDNARAGAGGDGIVLGSGARNVAINNVIWGNNGGIRVYFETGNAAVDAQVLNNTVVSNLRHGIQVDSGTTGTVVRNNIAYQNGSAFNDAGTGTVKDHNLVGPDPMFVNAAAFDFHLRPGSPALDTGLEISTVPTDADGVTRPQGPLPDIGAFERVP